MENSLVWRAALAEDAGSETLLLAHLDAAHNLARWLLRNREEAEDAVQDAYLRAFRSRTRLRGGDARAWILAIVRNCCYDRLKRQGEKTDAVFDEQVHSSGVAAPNPEAAIVGKPQIEEVKRALNHLPPHLREVVVLREFEEMTYAHIARIVQVPLGTVMSRLSRARQHLRQMLLAGGNGCAR